MKSYFIHFFFLLSISLSAQDIVLSGTVVSAEGLPIPLVNVAAQKSASGAVSNVEGRFLLRLSRKNQTIRLSHVGYKTLKSKLDLKTHSADTLYYTFRLEKEVELLHQLELSADLIQRAYDQPKIRILDFNFYEEGFIMLIAEDKEYKLRLIGAEQELIYDIPLSKHPKGLYRDCFDRYYVIFRADVEELIVEGDQYYLEKTCSMKSFQSSIMSCVVAFKSYMYFSEYTRHNQGLSYYKWDEEREEISLLTSVFDEGGYANAAGEMAFIMGMGGVGAISSMAENKFTVRSSRKVETSYEFYKNILAQPEYQPLLKLKGQLLFCNHMADTAYVYNKSGLPQRKFPINYHHQKGWKELLVDESGSYLFAKYERQGMVYLAEIDIQTGKLLESTRLEKHAFPSSIHIRDHIAYYLYKEPDYFTETNLYRQDLLKH